MTYAVSSQLDVIFLIYVSTEQHRSNGSEKGSSRGMVLVVRSSKGRLTTLDKGRFLIARAAFAGLCGPFLHRSAKTALQRSIIIADVTSRVDFGRVNETQ